MEAAMPHLRTLLSAVVAHSGAYEASKNGQVPVDAGGDVSLAHALGAVDADAAQFTDVDRIFWDSLSQEHAQDLMNDIGLLLASTTVKDVKLVHLMKVLLLDPLFDSVGVLQLVQKTFHGLKFAKRWDALILASNECIDAVYGKIYEAETSQLALQFWMEMLLGYQHAADLYQRNHARLADVAAFLGVQREKHAGDVDLAQQYQGMIAHFVLACVALMHCHRGYEQESYLLQLAMKQAFREEDLARPTAVAAETLLRESAWILPAETVGKYLPSIEGKWVLDEFSSDHQHAGASAPQNAGSVLLRKKANCFAHEITATIEGNDESQKFRLSGYVFQEIPEMQVLLSQPETIVTSPWELEGHWSQLYEANAATNSRPSAPVLPLPWNCHACTMSNEASATKCSTCGTKAPAKVTIQTSFDSSLGSNPAPFGATFDSSYSFMRMQWTRGEQRGVWLAKKQPLSRQFDFAPIFATAGNTMTDSSYLPMHVYSPMGKADNVLLLEKPIVSTGSNMEITLQVWIRPDIPHEESQRQAILSYGAEYALWMTSSGELVWEIVGGLCSVTSSKLVNFETFSHVTLLLGKHKMEMLIDGASVGDAEYGDDVRGNIFSARAPVFAIGGDLIAGVAPEIQSIFSGAVIDLRIWSALLVTPSSLTTALSGEEEHLIGYYPLVGDSQRILMDLSKQENHATVFEAFSPSDAIGREKQVSVVGNNFSPSVQVEELPVMLHFPTSFDSDFIGSGRFSLVDGVGALVIDRSGQGGALWNSSPVSVSCGFETSFEFALANAAGTSGDSRCAIFTLCESSYWNVSPLVAEASTLFEAPSASLLSISPASSSCFNRSALFVSIEAVPDGNGLFHHSIGLFVRSKKRNYALGRARQVATSTTSSLARVRYQVPQKVLSVELGEYGVVFECAVDIELALGAKSTSSIRSGLIFPAASSRPQASANTSIQLTQWYFSEQPHSEAAVDTAQSVLASVYPGVGSLQSPNKSGENAAETQGNTVICTRCSTDGSAIEQETFGCQTCGLIHGNTLCRICASVCHEGHELVAMGVMSAACACHIRGSGLCRCSSPVSADDFPQLQHPIVAPLWCCSKCTVINSVDLNECSVCGNKAPRNTSSVSANKPSTSTALALVEAPQPVPSVDWSCKACTMLNAPGATKCSICDTPRPKFAEPAGEADKSKDNNGLITLYYAAEDAAKKSQPGTRSSTPRSQSWFCSACTMENKGTDDTCYMCSTMRTVPIVDPVESSEVILALPPSKTDPLHLSGPIDLSKDATGEASTAPAVASPVAPSTKTENLKFLHGYKRTVAEASSQSECIIAMQGSTWETTAGKMELSFGGSYIAEYIVGAYADKDGQLSGIATINDDGVWKLEGKYKKLTQSQGNAFILHWDQFATRFDGKWYRGDGSGDWKCVASPNTSEFRGLTTVEDSKQLNHLQPYYSGMINMKQNLTNVCYQNSFLQTLFMTQDFRRLILASQLERYTSVPSDGAPSAGGNNILGCVQNLFARMVASQRPSLDSHALQRCLGATFQAGRQQDTSDFAHYLIDSLSEQLSQQHDTVDGISNVFGGVQATVLACKTCGKKSVNKEYFWELLLNMIDLRYTPITSITAVSGSSTDISTPTGYERLNNDLNKDRDGAPYAFLCVKRCPERKSTTAMNVDDTSLLPITDLVVKVAPSLDVKPTMVGYERVELDLNAGGSANVVGGKKQVYLFTRREPNGSPITDLQVIYGNESVPDGFKQIRVDLNQGEGMKVFLCYRCDMPITDLKIVNSGIPGYKMVDHLLNLSHDDSVKQYLAYQVGGNEPCLTDLKLVEGDDVSLYQDQGWTSIGSPSSVSVGEADPVEEDETPPVVPSQLMVRRGHGNPIFAIDVFRAPRQVPKYNDYEVIDLYPSENADDIPSLMKGDWMANEDTDRSRKAVRIHSASDPIAETLVVKGSFEDKGEIFAVANVTTTWAQSLSQDAGTSSEAKQVYHVTGYWKGPKVKQSQLFDVELRPDAVSNLYAINGTIGDGKGRPVPLYGIQTSQTVKVKWPISELMVLRGDEKVPEGVKIVRDTCSGKSGNLLAQTQSPHSLYLAVKREETPASGSYISDISVIYGEIDAIPEGYTCIQTTPGGFSANVNDGTSGVPIFICYRRAFGTPDEKVLMDVFPMWTSGPQVDALPVGFTKIQHTPLGMDANLNQGTNGVAIHLCYAKSDPAHVVKPVDNPLNGEYEITSSSPAGFGKFIGLSVLERVADARVVEGKFGTILHGYLPGSLRGIIFKSEQRQKQVMIGVCSTETQGNPTTMTDFMVASYPFELVMNDNGDEMEGWWSTLDETPASGPTVSPVASNSSAASSTNAGGVWKLMKDSYVRVAFKKDYGTEWKDGRLISSERVWRHDIASMLSRFVATRTLGGDNLLSCSQCEKKTESRTHTVIVSPPAHLILTLKRMFYDWTQQKTRKSLHDVGFPALLTLPSLTEEDEEAVFDESEENMKDKHRSRHYGLYGVLIHSGLTANSGHYYSFCRESDDIAQQLHLEDSPASPWIKFNDMKVERSNWKEINRLVANSVSDAVYLLLYKKLSYPIPDVVNAHEESLESPRSGGDDEEAMLLAKAMALSMSAASQKGLANQEAEEESKASETEQHAPRAYIDVSILKEVERENTVFMKDTLGATSSALHADDLHTLLVLRHSFPLHLRAILDQVQT
uniref:Ubiquitinyl hydrolase 1 n=1 Tax=Globisporangium ultimum (strain ATCC 200006 / CBS 805.95 / DAOM BR144) TaxID=431595 RepID=K3WU91_GLOUD